MRKRIFFIIVILGVAGAVVYAFRGSSPRTPANRIVVSGNIELTEVNIAFKTAGRLIERTVDEGDRVTKGQVIARLDRDQLMAQRSRETAGLESAQSQLMRAATALAERTGNLDSHDGELIHRVIGRYGPIPALDGITGRSLAGRLTSDKNWYEHNVKSFL